MEASTIRVAVTTKLPVLQNLIKRDPEGYAEDFVQQHRHFLSELSIFNLNPSKQSDTFGALVTFISHCAQCYPDHCRELPGQLMGLLRQHALILNPSTRVTLTHAVLLIRNRGLVEASALFPLLFELFDVQDKTLRSLIFGHIVSDLRKMHTAGANSKATKDAHALICSILLEQQHSEAAAKKALDLLVDLYRRRIWTGERSVNAIAMSCISKSTKISVVAMRFFLGIEQKMADDESKGADAVAEVKVDEHNHSKKTKSRKKQTERQTLAKNKKMVALKEGKHAPAPLFPALQIIRDPQGLAEKLFRKLRSSNESFEVRLLTMNMVSRLIGTHQLQLLSFYGFVQKYLANHQREVTAILAYLVQGCHELVPPDEILPVVKCIAFNFIAERCADEVIAVGLNAVREVMSRVPSALMEEGMEDLVQDFVMYTRSHDKSIKMASRSLINLVRETYPALLRRRDRGKQHDKGAKPMAFGATKVLEGVDGAELLEAYERGELQGQVNLSEDEFDEEEDQEDEEEDEEEEEGKEEAEKEEGDAWQDVDGEEGGEEGEWEEEGDQVKEGDGEDEDEDEEEEEDDEEEGEGEWADMPDDEGGVKTADGSDGEDEEEEEEEEEREEAPKGKESGAGGKHLSRKRPRLDVGRILSSEDFDKIRRLKEEFAKKGKSPRGPSAKMPTVRVPSARAQGGEEEFKPEALEAYAKRRRTTIEDRMASVLEGRSKFTVGGHAGGLTNTEKLRTKNQAMVRNSFRIKQKMQDSGRKLQNKKNKEVKTMKKESKKRRRT